MTNLLNILKNKSYRFSAVRNFVLDSLAKSNKPLCARDLQTLLTKNALLVNRTTLYRELNFLKKEGVIVGMQLKDNKRWYELALKNHHHHIMCVKCDEIKDFVGCRSKHITDKALAQAPDFLEIQSHNFDFFGLCKSCSKYRPLAK